MIESTVGISLFIHNLYHVRQSNRQCFHQEAIKLPVSNPNQNVMWPELVYVNYNVTFQVEIVFLVEMSEIIKKLETQQNT